MRFLVLLSLFLVISPVRAEKEVFHPLESIDQSSPRSTIESFTREMTHTFNVLRGDHGVVTSYLNSSRLWPTENEYRTALESIQRMPSLSHVLDLSKLPPAMAGENGWHLAIMLKEILDRIEIPPSPDIPGEAEIRATGLKAWVIPHTEIEIVRQADEQNLGKFVFSAKTVSRLQEFYDRVKSLPYKPGSTVGWLDDSLQKPTGLALAFSHILPPRWLLSLPGWTSQLIFDQPVWRWMALLVITLLFVLLVFVAGRLVAVLSHKSSDPALWPSLARPMAIVLLSPKLIDISENVLRFYGTSYRVLILTQWVIFYLALALMVWRLGHILISVLIDQKQVRSIDNLLIRLGMRLVTIILVLVVLLDGANRIGLPAYSLLAGFGIGGLAVALAAQQVLANLFASLIIMFEKPFSVGHIIELGQQRGRVTRIGLRSSTIQTHDGAEVIIPNSVLTTKEVVNWTLSDRRQRISLVFVLNSDINVKTVSNQLLKLALDNHEVLREPVPSVYFSAIGNNTVEFKLRVWVSHYEDGDRLESELRSKIWEALNSQGIEKPQVESTVGAPEPGKTVAVGSSSED